VGKTWWVCGGEEDSCEFCEWGRSKDVGPGGAPGVEGGLLVMDRTQDMQEGAAKLSGVNPSCTPVKLSGQ
jgi:hypothetical protein